MFCGGPNECIENVDEGGKGDGEREDGPVLPAQERFRPRFDGIGDFLHSFGPGVSPENIPNKEDREKETESADSENECEFHGSGFLLVGV